MTKLFAFILSIVALLVGVSLLKDLLPEPMAAVPDFWPGLRDPLMTTAGLGEDIARRVDYIVLCVALGLTFILMFNGSRRRAH